MKPCRMGFQASRNFDDSRIAQELGEVAPNRARFRRIGRSEVDQQHADLRLGHRSDGRAAGHARPSARTAASASACRSPAWIALATAGASTVVERPLIAAWGIAAGHELDEYLRRVAEPREALLRKPPRSRHSGDPFRLGDRRLRQSPRSVPPRSAASPARVHHAPQSTAANSRSTLDALVVADAGVATSPMCDP